MYKKIKRFIWLLIATIYITKYAAMTLKQSWELANIIRTNDEESDNIQSPFDSVQEEFSNWYE